MLPLGPRRQPVLEEVHSRGGHSSCSKQEVRTEEEKELGTQHSSQEQAPNDLTSFQEALFLKVLSTFTHTTDQRQSLQCMGL